MTARPVRAKPVRAKVGPNPAKARVVPVSLPPAAEKADQRAHQIAIPTLTASTTPTAKAKPLVSRGREEATKHPRPRR